MLLKRFWKKRVAMYICVCYNRGSSLRFYEVRGNSINTLYLCVCMPVCLVGPGLKKKDMGKYNLV